MIDDDEMKTNRQTCAGRDGKAALKPQVLEAVGHHSRRLRVKLSQIQDAGFRATLN